MTFEFDHVSGQPMTQRLRPPRTACSTRLQVFDDYETSETVYNHTAMPLVAYMFQKKGHGTVFAYGQTGRCAAHGHVSASAPSDACSALARSGKTYTMSNITEFVARDVFRALESREFRGKGYTVHVSFFEIYGARCTDLLHDRNKVTQGERGRGRHSRSSSRPHPPPGPHPRGRQATRRRKRSCVRPM